jgi:hypothetical protein
MLLPKSSNRLLLLLAVSSVVVFTPLLAEAGWNHCSPATGMPFNFIGRKKKKTQTLVRKEKLC